MSAWYFAILLCARASAAVVETVPTQAPSVSIGAAGAAAMGASAAAPLSLAPGGVSLTPALTPALSPSAPLSPAAIGAALGVPVGAGRVQLAPPAARASVLPASAVPSAEAPAAVSAGPSAASNVLPPPLASVAAAAAPAIAPPALPAREAAAGATVAAPRDAARAQNVSPEDAAAAGRAFWDQSDAFGRLDDAAAAVGAAFASPTAAASALRPGSSGALAPTAEDGALRDAVGAGIPSSPVFAPARLARAVATPGAALPAADAERAALFAVAALPRGAAAVRVPVERLTLSLGTGLVVRVRAAFGMGDFSAVASRRRTFSPGGSAARGAPPLTSTEWLERRGLIETASYAPQSAAPAAAAVAAGPSEAADAASASAPATRAASARAGYRFPVGTDSGSPLAWWALAFLPATLALLRDPLR